MSNIIYYFHILQYYYFLSFNFFFVFILTTYITPIQVYIMLFFHAFILEYNIYFTELYLYDFISLVSIVLNPSHCENIFCNILLKFIIFHNIYYIFTSLPIGIYNLYVFNNSPCNICSKDRVGILWYNIRNPDNDNMIKTIISDYHQISMTHSMPPKLPTPRTKKI